VTKKREKVHKVDRKGVEAHQNPVVSSGSSSGAVISGLGQPGGDRLEFWGGAGAGRTGFIWECWRGRGVRVRTESERSPGRSRSGVSCSSRTPRKG
jgi:hypothetical protein